mmetsp:Transcript_7230/g.17464  ORF Transcript_7230/g.17464 Transcript_7230/m.17464 type:complete len:206 (-) Transcript_7230:273-890(-)
MLCSMRKYLVLVTHCVSLPACRCGTCFCGCRSVWGSRCCCSRSCRALTLVHFSGGFSCTSSRLRWRLRTPTSASATPRGPCPRSLGGSLTPAALRTLACPPCRWACVLLCLFRDSSILCCCCLFATLLFKTLRERCCRCRSWRWRCCCACCRSLNLGSRCCQGRMGCSSSTSCTFCGGLCWCRHRLLRCWSTRCNLASQGLHRAR